MKLMNIIVCSSSVVLLSACTLVQPSPCDEIVFTSEQRQQCAQLQRQIVNAKQNPIKRTELERRYQKNCVDIRYYRDDKTDQRCKNKAEIDAIIRERSSQQDTAKPKVI